MRGASGLADSRGGIKAVCLRVPSVSGPGRSGEHLEIAAPGRDWRVVDGRFMMDPEASVSAVVFQHPDCTYFSVGDGGEVG
jgi:hypothetical protein